MDGTKETKTGQRSKSIRGAIVERLDEGDEVSRSELVSIVSKFYQSKTGHGQMFLQQRVSEALQRLLAQKLVVRVRRGWYKTEWHHLSIDGPEK